MASSRYRIDRDRDVSGPTELRIHGVGAAPPERILGIDDPVLVAGDRTAGFYRAEHDTYPAVEAYSWGGLTSRGSGVRGLKKALWVFLLPYALINTARFMLPDAKPPQESSGEANGDPVKSRRHKGTRVNKAREVLIDLLSYIATAGGFGLLFAITVDGVGLNCLLRDQPSPCARKLGLGWFSDIDWFVSYPSRMVVVSVLPALIALIGFGLIGRNSQKNFNVWARVPKSPASSSDDEGRAPLPMGRLSTWTTVRRSARLRRLHMAGALSLLAVAMSFSVARLDEFFSFSSEWGWPPALILAATAGIVVFVIAGVLSVRNPANRKKDNGDEPEEEDHAARDFHWWLRFSSYAILGITAVAGLAVAQPFPSADPFPPGESLLLAPPANSLVYERFGSEPEEIEGLGDAVEAAFGQPPPADFVAALPLILPTEAFPEIELPPDDELALAQEELVLAAETLLTDEAELFEEGDALPDEEAFFGALQAVAYDTLFFYLDDFAVNAIDRFDYGPVGPVFRLANDLNLPGTLELRVREDIGTQFLEDNVGRGGGWYFTELDATGIIAVYDVLAFGIALPLVFFLALLLAAMFLPPRNRGDGALGFAPPLVLVFGLLVGFLGLVSLSRWLFVYLDASLSTSFVTASVGILMAGTVALIAAIVVIAGSLLWVAQGRGRRLRRSTEAYWEAVHDRSRSDVPFEDPTWLEEQELRPSEARRLWSMHIDPDREIGGDGWLAPLDRVMRLGRLERWVVLPLAVAAIVPMVLLFTPEFNITLAYDPIMQGLALLNSLVYVPLLVLVVWRSRRIGHLWDVLTFWPRWGHPFAPPGYAHRAIPEISARIKHRFHDGSGKPAQVIVAGHSQGSVLAAAVVAGLPPANRRNVALLTYGSPLTRLYQRFFPRYFAEPQLRELAASLTREGPSEKTRWRNIYRRSDPIGWPIFSKSQHDDEVVFSHARDLGHIDVEAPDPWPTQPPRTGDPLPEVKGHSDYEQDPPYHHARDELWDMLGVQRADDSLISTPSGDALRSTH